MVVILFYDRASTSAMEAALSIVFNKTAVELSAQMVTDCANSIFVPGPLFINGNGCHMGDASDGISFMSSYTLLLVKSLLSRVEIQRLSGCFLWSEARCLMRIQLRRPPPCTLFVI